VREIRLFGQNEHRALHAFVVSIATSRGTSAALVLVIQAHPSIASRSAAAAHRTDRRRRSMRRAPLQLISIALRDSTQRTAQQRPRQRRRPSFPGMDRPMIAKDCEALVT